MNIRRTSTKLLSLAAVATIAVAVWATWATERVKAAPERSMDSGLIGVTAGQVVRFNAVNTGTRAIIIIGGKFLDSNGTLLIESRESRLLQPGQGVSFDLPGSERGRMEVHAVVSFVGAGDIDQLNTSTQIIDATGQSKMGWSNHNETLVRDAEDQR
ncbi:MAG: hypothetical protein HY235_07100 [Acidobacteria bacterium]|nr:hypothetical protein [Acidobacteriota bacterium]